MAGPARYSCGFLDIVQAESITQTGESIPPEKVTTHTHRYTIGLCLEECISAWLITCYILCVVLLTANAPSKYNVDPQSEYI